MSKFIKRGKEKIDDMVLKYKLDTKRVSEQTKIISGSFEDWCKIKYPGFWAEMEEKDERHKIGVRDTLKIMKKIKEFYGDEKKTTL